MEAGESNEEVTKKILLEGNVSFDNFTVSWWQFKVCNYASASRSKERTCGKFKTKFKRFESIFFYVSSIFVIFRNTQERSENSEHNCTNKIQANLQFYTFWFQNNSFRKAANSSFLYKSHSILPKTNASIKPAIKLSYEQPILSNTLRQLQKLSIFSR